MRTLKIKKQNLNKVIKEAVKSIKNGEVIICPTDTVYGLICDALNEKAVKKLFKIKKRPKEKQIPIFVRDIKMAKKFARINKKQEKFLREVWPGAVTVILKAKDKKTIGIRIPKYKFILNLIKEINRPLAESSANISGSPASTKIKEVLKQFKNQSLVRAGKGQPDLVLDAGSLESSLPSTVIDLTNSKPKITRSGEFKS